MKILRDYQTKIKHGIYEAWNAGHRNVLAVSPTGSGKTAIKADIFHECQFPGFAIAHRQELVVQISCALADSGTPHRIVAPTNLVQFIVGLHVRLFGRSFVHHQAPMAVAGVDTLLRRASDGPFVQFANQVRVWDIDEAHHVLLENKWGKATNLFPNALGLGFTATPVRADKKQLGRKSGTGLFDYMVLGPTMRDLIDQGHLADYRIYGPKASIDRTVIEISKATGELNQDQTRKEAHKSKIVGDIVSSYLRFTPGKLGITFTVDVELAHEQAAAFMNAGIPSAAVSAKTPDALRTELIEKHARREILQLVNVDLFGEGFDVPAVEVVSMGRPTASYGLYIQQFGRALRPYNGKTHGIIIDHVDNVKVHKLPDRPRVWSLDDVDKSRSKKSDDAMPVRTCTACFQCYEAVTKTCPYCGHVEVPAGRSLPEHVDGDLTEYSPELLEALRKGQALVDGAVRMPQHVSDIAAAAIRRNHSLRQEAQQHLRDAIALWAGIQRDVHNRSDSESYRRFYHTFGIDVASATLLGRPEAEKLTQLVRDTYT